MEREKREVTRSEKNLQSVTHIRMACRALNSRQLPNWRRRLLVPREQRKKLQQHHATSFSTSPTHPIFVKWIRDGGIPLTLIVCAPCHAISCVHLNTGSKTFGMNPSQRNYDQIKCDDKEIGGKRMVVRDKEPEGAACVFQLFAWPSRLFAWTDRERRDSLL